MNKEIDMYNLLIARKVFNNGVIFLTQPMPRVIRPSYEYMFFYDICMKLTQI